MKLITTAAMSATKRTHLKALSGLIMAWLALSVLGGCDSARHVRPKPSPCHLK